MQQIHYKKYIFLILLFSVIIAFIFIYKKYDPANNNIFPKCPINYFTGYKCPGCGSQRALHELLNGNLKNAFYQNQLLVLSIPYLMFGIIVDKYNKKNKLLFIRKYLYGQHAIYIIIIILFSFTFIRNTNIT